MAYRISKIPEESSSFVIPAFAANSSQTAEHNLDSSQGYVSSSSSTTSNRDRGWKQSKHEIALPPGLESVRHALIQRLDASLRHDGTRPVSTRPVWEPPDDDSFSTCGASSFPDSNIVNDCQSTGSSDDEVRWKEYNKPSTGTVNLDQDVHRRALPAGKYRHENRSPRSITSQDVQSLRSSFFSNVKCSNKKHMTLKELEDQHGPLPPELEPLRKLLMETPEHRSGSDEMNEHEQDVTTTNQKEQNDKNKNIKNNINHNKLNTTTLTTSDFVYDYSSDPHYVRTLCRHSYPAILCENSQFGTRWTYRWTAQEQLGNSWTHSVLGRWSTQWLIVQKNHYTRLHTNRILHRWTLAIILKRVMTIWNLWDFRNSVTKSNWPIALSIIMNSTYILMKNGLWIPWMTHSDHSAN